MFRSPIVVSVYSLSPLYGMSLLLESDLKRFFLRKLFIQSSPLSNVILYINFSNSSLTVKFAGVLYGSKYFWHALNRSTERFLNSYNKFRQHLEFVNAGTTKAKSGQFSSHFYVQFLFVLGPNFLSQQFQNEISWSNPSSGT